MADKNTPKPDKFDDEMRARLVFYNQLAAGAAQADRIRRRRANDQSYKLPKDAADKFIERIGLAENDAAVPIPVHRVEEDERSFTKQPLEGYEAGAVRFQDSLRRIGHAIAASAASFGTAMLSLVSLPATGVRKLTNRQPHEHYEAGVATAAARSHSRRLTWRGVITAIAIAAVLLAAGAASFLFFHQRAVDQQRQAAQAQFEREHQAYICSLADYEIQQGKPVTVDTSGCASPISELRF